MLSLLLSLSTGRVYFTSSDVMKLPDNLKVRERSGLEANGLDQVGAILVESDILRTRCDR